MNRTDAEEYTQALGQVVAGGWRQIALGQRLGVPKALGLSVEEWVKTRLGGYLKLSLEEVRIGNKELKEQGHSERGRAAILGVGKTTIHRESTGPNGPLDIQNTQESEERQDSTGPNGPAEPLDILAGLAADEDMRKSAERLTAKEAAAMESRVKREASRRAGPRADGYHFHLGDARDVLGDVRANSVHLVLTDPPYGDEAEPLYRWLGAFSARVLVEGGSLICFTGQARLDRDLQILSEHLRYWWLLAIRHNQAQRLPGKFVMAEFKPVMWFVKHRRRGKTLVVNDVLRSDRRDKAGHDWGQGDGGVELLIEQLTDPDDLIIDPFAGTGAWGRIAARMGRVWVGSDVVDGGDTVVQVTR